MNGTCDDFPSCAEWYSDSECLFLQENRNYWLPKPLKLHCSCLTELYEDACGEFLQFDHWCVFLESRFVHVWYNVCYAYDNVCSVHYI